MKILVINCGSSSLKYQLIDMETEELMAKGLVERIGIEGSRIKHETIGKEKKTIETPMQDHKRALELVMESLTNEEYGAIKSLDEIDAVGHRVVHGGEDFAQSVIIDEKVLKGIEDNVEIAPLHNPPNIMGIKACQRLLPNVKQVAVFDTAFHQTMPAESYIYALPYEYYEKYKIRRFGFHGTSHKYITNRAAEMLGKDVNEVNLITCHLGNGSSICAVKNGKSIDTSMGFTPLEGLAMGTRCGDLDPAILPFLMEKENLSTDEINTLINKKSGVLGISGVSSDFRDIEAARDEERAAATVLRRSILEGKKAIDSGNLSKEEVLKIIKGEIEKERLARIDYVEIIDFDTFDQVETIKDNTLIAMAVYIGKTRLIDNLVINL